jgi:hypothetical protein
LRDGNNLIQIAFECCRFGRRLLLLRFQKQLWCGKDALSLWYVFSVAPSVVEQGGLPRGPVLLGEGLRYPLAMLGADSRHRRQIPHGDLRRDAALAHLLLHRFRQRFHQRQAARHPRGAAVEAPRQVFD